MDKLTIEHLAAYLPYDIKCQYIFYDDGEKSNPIVSKIESIYKDCVTFVNGSCDYYFEDDYECEIKLLLRPLFDLTTEIEHNGEKFVPIVELIKIKYKKWYDEKKGSRYADIDFELNTNYVKAHFSFMATLCIEIWLRDISHEEYWVVQKLLSWHFDIYNLIPQKLAIDIKEVNND